MVCPQAAPDRSKLAGWRANGPIHHAAPLVSLADSLAVASDPEAYGMTKQHHPICALNIGEEHCNCMHPKVVVIKSVHGEHVSFSDYLSLQADRDRLRAALEQIARIRQGAGKLGIAGGVAEGISISKIVSDALSSPEER